MVDMTKTQEASRAALFNDLAAVQTDGWLHLGDHQAIANHLWEQGWRREMPGGVEWDDLAEWERRILWDQTNVEIALLAKRLDAVRAVLDRTAYHPLKDAIAVALDGQ